MSSHASTYTFVTPIAIYYASHGHETCTRQPSYSPVVALMLQALWSWCRTCCYCWLLHASLLLQIQTEHPQSID